MGHLVHETSVRYIFNECMKSHMLFLRPRMDSKLPSRQNEKRPRVSPRSSYTQANFHTSFPMRLKSITKSKVHERNACLHILSFPAFVFVFVFVLADFQSQLQQTQQEVSMHICMLRPQLCVSNSDV